MYRTSFILLLAALPLFPGCSRELSPDEQAQVVQLKASLSKLDDEILVAEEKDRLYSGGLVKGLIATRLEILRINRELLYQRILALESGAKIEITVQAKRSDPARAVELATEIKEQENKVALAAREADRYSGGLVGAMKQTNLVTEEQSLALLRQSFLEAKYGLFYPVTELAQLASTSEGKSTPSAASGPIRPSDDQQVDRVMRPSEPPASTTPKVEILNIDAKITERNSVWSKFSWQLTVRNLTENSIRFRASIEFLDSDGFVVDDDSESQLVLDPYSEGTFRGYALVDADIAGNVEQVNAKVQLQ